MVVDGTDACLVMICLEIYDGQLRVESGLAIDVGVVTVSYRL